MRVVVVAGYREYFEPHPVPLEAIAAAIAPAAKAPRVRWIEPAPAYHTFLFEEPPRYDRRVALFVEYLGDVIGPDETAVVVLPCDRIGAPGVDPRVVDVVGRARASFGPGNVELVHLHVSPNTDAVLRRLLVEAGEAPAAPAEARPLTSPEMARNWALAVLTVAEQIVGERSVFRGVDRVEQLARALDHNQLHLRTDLDPERVVDELRPGGELFELMTRPLPPAPDPLAVVGAALAPAITRPT